MYTFAHPSFSTPPPMFVVKKVSGELVRDPMPRISYNGMNGLLNAEFTPVRTSPATGKVGTVSVELRGTDVVVGIVLVDGRGTAVVVDAGSRTSLAAETDVGEDDSALL